MGVTPGVGIRRYPQCAPKTRRSSATISDQRRRNDLLCTRFIWYFPLIRGRRRSDRWCRMQDSNPRPLVYKTTALPSELIRPIEKQRLFRPWRVAFYTLRNHLQTPSRFVPRQALQHPLSHGLCGDIAAGDGLRMVERPVHDEGNVHEGAHAMKRAVLLPYSSPPAPRPQNASSFVRSRYSSPSSALLKHHPNRPMKETK